MTKDCYGTCPKCGEMGWCHYKGKARIFKSGPGSGTYKVSLFKCGNCGKKFGFELEDDIPEPRLNEEEDDSEDWKTVFSIIRDIDDLWTVSGRPINENVKRLVSITNKHC